METTKILTWDVTDHLQTKEDIADYLEAALEEGEPDVIIAALQDIIRAKGFTQLTHNIEQERLSDPIDFMTVLKVVEALGLKLQTTAL